MTIIRPADLTDLPAIEVLVRTAFDRWTGVLGREPGPMKADYKSAISAKEVWVIGDENGLKGMMSAIVESDAFFIDVLAVLPFESRRGYGTKLLVKAYQLARMSGKPIVRLKTVVHYLDNLVFYGRRGFCIKAWASYDGIPVLTMERNVGVNRDGAIDMC